MSLYFVADVHLNEAQPAITAGFLRFLQQLPDNSQLYILGDLFDYWVGDDAATPLHHQIADALRELSLRGIKKYFIHGNRDFLVGQRYAIQCDMQILPAITLIPSAHDNLLILHGDLLCTDDQSYQRFRRYMHSHWLQKIFLWLPLYLRNKIANRLRNKSQQHNAEKSAYIMDVNPQAVIDMMNKYQTSIMIHGHTHKPAVHSVALGSQQGQRFVLGAWHDNADYVVVDKGKIVLNSIVE